jgi:hypothetical protein
MPPKTYSILEKHNQKFANLWVLDRESPYPSVGFDNFRAAQQITVPYQPGASSVWVHMGGKKRLPTPFIP